MRALHITHVLLMYLIPLPVLSAITFTDVQSHGFISQNYIQTQSNNFFGRSQGDGSFAYKEFGLNGSARLNKRTLTALQLTSRHAGKTDNGSIEVDYALTDVQINTSGNYRAGLRAGRIKIPLGLYNETRGAPMTRLGILLPQSIYFERTRNVAVSADGAELYLTRHLDAGDLSFRLLSAQPNLADKASETNLFTRELPGSLRNRNSYAFRILYEHNSGKAQLALSHLQLNIDYKAANLDVLPSGSIRFQPTILSAQYGTEFWTFTAEYALRQFKFQKFGPAANDFDGESFYYQVSHHYNNQWELFARRDMLFTNKKDRQGKEYALNSGDAAHRRYAKDWTIGLLYKASTKLSIKLQHHWVNGTAWLPPADNPDVNNIARRWKLLAASVTLHY